MNISRIPYILLSLLPLFSLFTPADAGREAWERDKVEVLRTAGFPERLWSADGILSLKEGDGSETDFHNSRFRESACSATAVIRQAERNHKSLTINCLQTC